MPFYRHLVTLPSDAYRLPHVSCIQQTRSLIIRLTQRSPSSKALPTRRNSEVHRSTEVILIAVIGGSIPSIDHIVNYRADQTTTPTRYVALAPALFWEILFDAGSSMILRPAV
jgi:hypothetical protein